MVGRGVMRTGRQLAGIPVTAGQIECLQDFHDLIVRLHVLLLGCWVLEHAQHTEEDAPVVDPPGQLSIGKADLVSPSGQFSWPPAGRFVAVYGHDLMAADTRQTSSAGGQRRHCRYQVGRGLLGLLSPSIRTDIPFPSIASIPTAAPRPGAKGRTLRNPTLSTALCQKGGVGLGTCRI